MYFHKELERISSNSYDYLNQKLKDVYEDCWGIILLLILVLIMPETETVYVSISSIKSARIKATNKLSSSSNAMREAMRKHLATKAKTSGAPRK